MRSALKLGVSLDIVISDVSNLLNGRAKLRLKLVAAFLLAKAKLKLKIGVQLWRLAAMRIADKA